jgi:mannosyl-oligosaccharide glucosidase
VRHSCDQNDGLETYTWTEYDVREGGVQVLKDGKNNVKLTTEFLKIPGGRHGGSWAARIKGEPIDPGMSLTLAHATCDLHWVCVAVKPLKLSTIFYLGLEGMGGIDMDTAGDENVRTSSVVDSTTTHHHRVARV